MDSLSGSRGDSRGSLSPPRGGGEVDSSMLMTGSSSRRSKSPPKSGMHMPNGMVDLRLTRPPAPPQNRPAGTVAGSGEHKNPSNNLTSINAASKGGAAAGGAPASAVAETKEKENLAELFGPVKNSRLLEKEPKQQETQRRADPKRRKKEREVVEFPDGGADAPPSTKNMFGDMSNDAIKRLHSMITNFCKLEDGTLTRDVDLRQYSKESGQSINNIVVQELCHVQPKLNMLNLTNCVEVTDAGLWTIARHCDYITKLILSGCDTVTHIGLRSLSLRCASITALDFSFCNKLDDMALSTIAGGAWQLKELSLRGCPNITDTGISKIAKTNNGKMIQLDLNGCTNLGEFGNTALKDLGQHCYDLRELDLSGCRRIEDAGIRALALGCQNIEQLLLSGCENVTGSSLKQLCRNSKQLNTLSLIGCKQLTDRNMEYFQNSESNVCAFQNSIRNLDLTRCVLITDKGCETLCQSIGSRLRKLSLAACNLTDMSSVTIGKYCTNLRELDLSMCVQLSDNTVHELAKKVTALTSLKLDGAKYVTLSVLNDYLRKLEFCDFATKWYGYQPKLNVEALIESREISRWQTINALKIQCMIRKKIAFRVWRVKRKWWLMNKVIPLFQAQFRGSAQRKRWRAILYQIMLVKKAIILQSFWRKFIQIQRRIRVMKEMRFKAYKTQLSIRIQRNYRGLVSRRRVVRIRNDLMNQRIKEAKIKVKREFMAGMIQRAFRAMVGRIRSVMTAEERQKQIEHRLLRERCLRFIQRIMRGKLGKNKANRRRKELWRFKLEWDSTIIMQKGMRGMFGRTIARLKRRQRYERLLYTSTRCIQRHFRGFKGRLLAAVARALKLFRAKQQVAASEIQRIARGMIGRIHARLFRELEYRRRTQIKAANKIQKIFRGHKGREAAEVEKALLKLEGLAKPLFDLLRRYEREFHVLSKECKRLEFMDRVLQDDIYEMEREIQQVEYTTQKYTDSSRINGIPQRFMTKYLKIRLKDHYDHEKEAYQIKFKEFQKKKIEVRQMTNNIDSVKRELVPLTTGKVWHLKLERSRRLREQVRNVRRACCKIQALWRRALVRVCLQDPIRDYWIECYDENQGEENFYFNTWTKETSWKMPRSYLYFCGGLINDGTQRVSKTLLDQHLASGES